MTWRALALAVSLTPIGGCDPDGANPRELGDGAMNHLDAAASDGSAVADALGSTYDASDGGEPRDGAQGDGEAGNGVPDAGDGAPDAGDGAPDAGDAQVRPNVDRTNPKLIELEIDPKLLDENVADSLSLQYAQLDTRAAPLGRLVVFLPGATNVPRDWRDHGRALASFGFHVLIPHYNNRWSSDGTCSGRGSSCGDDTRWEALVGEDASSAIVIARGDSAEGRVIAMLKHLSIENPAGDWGYYLAGENLAYDKTIIAGISHGAASAGMYAARRPFTRNVMHASGPAGSPAAAKMTPISAWYGFVHTADDAYDAITGAWDRFALIGDLSNVDGATAPFAGTHRLTTSAATSYPHGSVCASGPSPKDADGKYLFEQAWRYLYGVLAR